MGGIMGLTLAEKIISSHCDKEVVAGELVIANIDVCAVQDGTGPLTVQEFKKIGKETLRSPEWAFLGESIVDYLPINDEWGNVLPGSDRIYAVTWKGFAYQTVDNGKSVIKFQSPWQYYTEQSENNAKYLLPWEKLKIFVAAKKIRAKIYLEYRGDNNTPVPYETEKDVFVKYNYIGKGINYGAILLILLVVLIAWKLIRRRDDHIEELEEEVDDLEDEVDELEKAKKMAKKALAQKKTTPAKKETPKTVTKKPVVKKPPVKRSSSKKDSSETPKA